MIDRKETRVVSGKKFLDVQPFSKDNFKQEIAALKEHLGKVNVLSICYHGLGRSAEMSHALHEMLDDSSLRYDNAGIQTLSLNIAYVLRDQPEAFEQLAEALLAAEHIVLFIQYSDLNNDFQRRLYQALLTKANQLNKRLLYNPTGSNFPEIVRTIQLSRLEASVKRRQRSPAGER
jgi:hypothetical protein